VRPTGLVEVGVDAGPVGVQSAAHPAGVGQPVGGAGGAGSAQQAGRHVGMSRAGIVCVHNSASAQPRASAPAACAAPRAWHAPSCGDTAQCGGSGLTGRPPRRGDGPTPSPLHAPRRASAAPTGHLQRALPSDNPLDADGCRVARCSPPWTTRPMPNRLRRLSSSRSRHRAPRSSVSTRSRAIGSDRMRVGAARSAASMCSNAAMSRSSPAWA